MHREIHKHSARCMKPKLAAVNQHLLRVLLICPSMAQPTRSRSESRRWRSAYPHLARCQLACEPNHPPIVPVPGIDLHPMVPGAQYPRRLYLHFFPCVTSELPAQYFMKLLHREVYNATASRSDVGDRRSGGIGAVSTPESAMHRGGEGAAGIEDKYTLRVPGGLAFSDFKGYEDWQLISSAKTDDRMKVILGNPTIIAAYKSGIPGNGKPFPEGSKIAKVQWKPKKSTEAPFAVDVQDTLADLFFMKQDSKKFPDTGGYELGVAYAKQGRRSKSLTQLVSRPRRLPPNEAGHQGSLHRRDNTSPA
jgi:Cytochrome P460